jgi:hypothetical protein
MAEAKKPLFVADPACVYFPVSTVGAGTVLRQFIRVINVGIHSARLGIPRASTDHPSLTSSVDVKQGYVASGLHQVIEIQYCPENFDVINSFVGIEGEVRRLSSNGSPKRDALQNSFPELCRR